MLRFSLGAACSMVCLAGDKQQPPLPLTALLLVLLGCCRATLVWWGGCGRHDSTALLLYV